MTEQFFSFQLTSLTFPTGNRFAHCRMLFTLIDDAAQSPIFYAPCYGGESETSIPDLKEVIETYMNQFVLKPDDFRSTVCRFTAKLETVSILDSNNAYFADRTFDVLYCRRSVDSDSAADYVMTHCLSLASPNLPLCIPSTDPMDSNLFPVVAYDDQLNTFWYAGDGMQQSQGNVWEDGSRRMEYKVIHAPVWRNFVFANNFNMPELLHLPCTLSYEIKTDYSEAETEQGYSQYNVSRVKTFTVRSCAIPRCYVSYLEDFLTSPVIMLSDQPTDSLEWYAQWQWNSFALRKQRIRLLSYKYQPTDQLGDRLTLEFTFRFADPLADIQPTTAEQIRIFEQTFNYVFN